MSLGRLADTIPAVVGLRLCEFRDHRTEVGALRDLLPLVSLGRMPALGGEPHGRRTELRTGLRREQTWKPVGDEVVGPDRMRSPDQLFPPGRILDEILDRSLEKLPVLDDEAVLGALRLPADDRLVDAEELGRVRE